MDLGFDTIGNATLIAHDRGPVLVTDPWLGGPAYFGSWGLSHSIPDEQRNDIAHARWVWFSHGHPDHLHPGSLGAFRNRQILLGDHRGNRIADTLRKDGFNVTVLPDNVWTPLSDRIRVLCIADYNQDSTLLVDVGGRLVVDMNDSGDRGWGGVIRRHVAQYPISFLLRLSGFGDADMINFHDEQGNRIPSPAAIRKTQGYQVGAQAATMAESLGVRYSIPFSSFHRYERQDSAWANAVTTDVSDYTAGFSSKRCEQLPAFTRYDCATDAALPIDPAPCEPILSIPGEHGDDWSEQLERSEARTVTSYFRAIHHLGTFLEFVTLRVGGEEHVARFGTRHAGRGLTFEVPRGSLLKAVEWEIFDDLMIGNFMRTVLHGRWPEAKLSVDVTPYVAKYADNGRARTEEELQAYFAAYRRRLGPIRALRHALERKTRNALRSHLRQDSPFMHAATRTYQCLVAHR